MTFTANRHLDKFRVFEGTGYIPHLSQRKIHALNARMKVAACGRRFGKSVIGGNELIPEAMLTYPRVNELEEAGQRREFWIVGPEYSDSEKEFRIFWDKAVKLGFTMDKPGSYNNPENGDMHCSMFGGKFMVHAKSAKYPQTLVGEGLSGVILAEAAKLKERVWTKYIRPTLADFMGWALLTSTPEGKNWFHAAYKRGQDPEDLSWASWQMPSWRNPIVFPKGATPEAIELLERMLTPRDALDREITLAMIRSQGIDEEILDMGQDMSGAKFQQEIGAKFTDFAGRVFQAWDSEVHVGDLDYDPRYPIYACCDYGWTNPFVWLVVQVDPWDKLNVLYEYRASRKDINEIAEDLNAHPLTQHCKVLYPDPAGPGDTAVLEKKLRILADTNTGGELKHRLELIRGALKISPQHGLPEFKRPQMMVDRKCYEFIREMDEYRYPETKEEQLKSKPEHPMDKDDHGPEALGRFFKGYYGGPLDGVTGKSRVRGSGLS